MAEIEDAPQTPAVDPTEGMEVGSVPEADSTPQTGAEGPSLDELRANLEQTSTALKTSEDLRAQLNSQIDELETRVKAAEVALERERVGRRHGLPDELMAFLRGESAEELEAEAQTLAKYASAGSSGLGTGGLDPTEVGSNGIVGRIIRKSREL